MPSPKQEAIDSLNGEGGESIVTCDARMIPGKVCCDCEEDITDCLIVQKKRGAMVYYYHRKCYDALQDLFREAEEFEGEY